MTTLQYNAAVPIMMAINEMEDILLDCRRRSFKIAIDFGDRYFAINRDKDDPLNKLIIVELEKRIASAKKELEKI